MVFSLDLLCILNNMWNDWYFGFDCYLGCFCFEFFDFEVVVDGCFGVYVDEFVGF